jgi:hypothetical protein
MPLENLYFEIRSRQFVRSHESPTPIPPPVWGHGDTRDFGVTFLQRVSLTSYQVIQSVVSAEVSIAALTAPNTILTSYTAVGATNNEFPFLLNCATPLTALMGSATEDQQVRGMFRLITTAGEARYPFDLFIAPRGPTATTVDSTAEDPGLTKNTATGLFMPKEVPPGTRWVWTDEVTGELGYFGFRNGQFGNLQ